MENREKIKLTINELPPRAEKLSRNEVRRVLGGHYGTGDGGYGSYSCISDCDCLGDKCIKEAGKNFGTCSE